MSPRLCPTGAAGIACKNMDEDAEDTDLSEYLSRVRWLKTVPLNQAVREPG
jgi:hypothetical protein